MIEEPSMNLSRKQWFLYGLILVVLLLILSLVIESCATEKVRVCDTTTGDCELESVCRPLLFELLS